MSIARINMMEFLTEKDLESSENLYEAIQKEWFANAQTVINVRTGPKSLLNLAVYSSYEDAETNLPKRKEFQDILKKINLLLLIVFTTKEILLILKAPTPIK